MTNAAIITLSGWTLFNLFWHLLNRHMRDKASYLLGAAYAKRMNEMHGRVAPFALKARRG